MGLDTIIFSNFRAFCSTFIKNFIWIRYTKTFSFILKYQNFFPSLKLSIYPLKMCIWWKDFTHNAEVEIHQEIKYPISKKKDEKILIQFLLFYSANNNYHPEEPNSRAKSENKHTYSATWILLPSCRKNLPLAHLLIQSRKKNTFWHVKVGSTEKKSLVFLLCFAKCTRMTVERLPHVKHTPYTYVYIDNIM